MDIDCIFNSLLFCDIGTVTRCLLMSRFTKSLDTKYFWKILCERYYENKNYDKILRKYNIKFSENEFNN